MRLIHNRWGDSSCKVAGVILILLTPTHAYSAKSPDVLGTTVKKSEPTIAPPDVYVQVMLVRAEADLIRREMGKQKLDRPEIAVSGAAPHEVYFQTLTMFNKAERLCYEQTRARSMPPSRPQGPISPPDVYTVVDATLHQLQGVKEKLAIPETSPVIPRDNLKTPTDVFRAVVQANRTLNLLLQDQFSPSDVFQEVTLAIGYSARLLEQFPDAKRIPSEPAWERRKKPADVYRRLIDCYGLIHTIATASGFSIAELRPDQAAIEHAQPGDVYDVASLLVSDLAYLHAQRKDSRPPRDVFNPGDKLPAHVFQRIGILEAQLVQLKTFVQANPDWWKVDVKSQ